ncbi:restriction endonuclease [Motiliproteus sediminis]|uniref:restriction endonuclease n=1 Tax=Motiliproteus sediminis TaxID=1468178 RepID=UPI001AEFF570|nr:restriction endonuclease [Motiliproteus sediminis]
MDATKKLTIVDAAEEALKNLGGEGSVAETYARIIELELYRFGAKDPLAVLRIQMERHCESTTWSGSAKKKRFRKDDYGRFSLIDNQRPLIEKPKSDSQHLIRQLADKLKQDTIDRIVDHLYSLEPEQFENFCSIFLERYGFEEMSVTPRGKDGGIDAFGKLEIGMSKLDVAAQCKRYKRNNKVSRPDIDQFRGAIQGKYHQGIFVTTSTFSKDAKAADIQPGCVPIVLVDGEKLAEIMIEKGIGVSVHNIPIYDFEMDLV